MLGGVEPFPARMGSLARGVPPDAGTDTLFVLTSEGGVQVAPGPNVSVSFGRSERAVDVCLGRDDGGVSRKHGIIEREGSRWWIHNVGRLPIHLPGSRLLLMGHHEPLPQAYTPLFIRTDSAREHVIEVRVVGLVPPAAKDGPDQETRIPRLWDLSMSEKLVLVALGQRYLRHERDPQPLSWSEVSDRLAEREPGRGWTSKSAAHRVRDVRLRLAAAGVPGLTEKEVARPIGNTLNHNLLTELLGTTTLVPPDLALLGDGETWEYRDQA